MDTNNYERETEYGDDENESEEFWSDTDESDYDELIYEPEETSQTKFNIVLVEKYNNLIHGLTYEEMNFHHLVMSRIKYSFNFNFNYFRQFLLSSRLEMAECIYLPSGHCIGILKTFWLKLIQRTWKKICKERKMCLIKRCNMNSIYYREINGKWPSNCSRYPGIKGMLNYLS
jgi:hypothetical protein